VLVLSLFVDETATSVAISTVTVSTTQPGLVAVLRQLVAAFLTDWLHTWHYTEGLAALRCVQLLSWTPSHRSFSVVHVIFGQCLFIYFYGRLILRPWLTEVRESFTRSGP